MKKFALIAFTTIFLAIVAGCSGEKDPGNGNDPDGDESADLKGEGWSLNVPEGLDVTFSRDLEEGGHEIALEIIEVMDDPQNFDKMTVHVDDYRRGHDCGYGLHGVYNVFYYLTEESDGRVRIDLREVNEPHFDENKIVGCGEITGQNGTLLRFKMNADESFEPLYLELMESARFK